MTKGQLNDQEISGLMVLQAELERRKPLYRTGEIAGAWAIIDGKKRLYRAIFRFGRKPTPRHPSEMEWEELHLFHRRLSVAATWSLFEQLVRSGSLGAPRLPTLEFDGTLGIVQKNPGWRYPLFDPWPGWHGEVQVQGGSTMPSFPLARKGLPLFMDTSSAMDEWIGTRPIPGSSQPWTSIFLPDPRARIDGLEVGSTGFRVGIMRGTAARDSMYLKYHAIAPGVGPVHREVRLKTPKTDVRLGFQPESLMVALFRSCSMSARVASLSVPFALTKNPWSRSK